MKRSIKFWVEDAFLKQNNPLKTHWIILKYIVKKLKIGLFWLVYIFNTLFSQNKDNICSLSFFLKIFLLLFLFSTFILYSCNSSY